MIPTWQLSWRLIGVVIALIAGALALAACGGDETTVPPPTVASMNEFATRGALEKTSSALEKTSSALDKTATQIALEPTDLPPSPTASAMELPTELPTEFPTETPLPSAIATMPPPTLTATPTITDSPEPSPTATVTDTPTLSPADRTATRAAEVAPMTQTAEAIQGGTLTAEARVAPYTQTAQAILALTPPTATPRVMPEFPYQIVYYTNRHGNDDLYLMTRDGQERALLTFGANERDPSCAPHSDAVVYASDATGSFQIFRLDLDKRIPVQLTDSEGMNFAPVYNPAGDSIAFVSTRNGGVPTIWLMDADGANQRQVTTTLGRDAAPAWGPDGRLLVFAHEQTGPWDLYLTALNENFDGEVPLMPPEFNDGNQVFPAFDGLGERVIYTSWADLDDPQTSDIYLLDFEQPEPRAVIEGEGAAIAWSWLNDTQVIASVGPPDDVQIALINVDTGEVERLSQAGTFNGGARLCTVAPDILLPEPTPAPSPTPSPTPVITPTTQAITLDWAPLVLDPETLAAQGQKHVVQPGDTLMRIGYQYGVNWMELATINTLVNPDRLRVGQTLTVPIMRVRPFAHGHMPIDGDWDEYALALRKEIVVDISDQRVTAYEDGRPIHTARVSTGLPGTPTVLGEYSIYVKYEAQTMSGPGYYLPNVPYVMYFYRGYGLHGAYWHDNFGQPMSHGCVNLSPQEAKWFYYWAEIGTPVLVKS